VALYAGGLERGAEALPDEFESSTVGRNTPDFLRREVVFDMMVVLR